MKGEELKDERWRVEGEFEGEKDTAVDSLCEWPWVGKSKVTPPNQEGTTSPTIARCDSILSIATVFRCLHSLKSLLTKSPISLAPDLRHTHIFR